MKRVLITTALAVLVLVVGSCSGNNNNNNVVVKPTVTAVTPLTAAHGASVTFSFTNTGGAGTSWSWDFGGGGTPNTSGDKSPTVTAGAAGTYHCIVTAANSAGTSSFNFDLTVT